MNRRKFVKQSCTICMAVSSGMLVAALSSCSAMLPIYHAALTGGDKLAVPLALFEKSDFRLIQPQNILYNIGLKKEADGSFTALLLRCTHADNQLTSTGNGYNCTLHGSTFDNEGRVTHGPAERPLKRYPTQLTGQQIIIQLS